MNKLAVIIPFYKRPELTKLCFRNIKRQSKKLGFDVIVAGSEGDESKKLARGLKYIEVDNQPLSNKLNALMNKCKKYDGVVIIGSDDFMSDSVIEMYKEIDCTKEVYYSFNDIYIYSAKYKQIRSDFDYTRAGNGIGVARLYTKPTLKKMNYKIWENDRPKGLDGNADKRLKAKGIKEVQIDLDTHFLIDVKLEQNISAHEMVFSGHKEHPLEEINRLGRIGKDILSLKSNDKERVYNNQHQFKKITCRVLKPFNGHNVGDVVQYKEHNYKQLIKNGWVSPLT